MEYHQLPENRRHARIPHDLEIRILDLESRVADNRASILDVSRKGFSLKSRLPLEQGDRLVFCLPLPDGRNIQGDAEVRWSRPFNELHHTLGLDIVRLGFWERLRFNQFLAPRGTGLLQGLDAALQGAFSIAALWLFKEIVFADPVVRGAALHVLPYALLVFGPFAGLYFLSSRR